MKFAILVAVAAALSSCSQIVADVPQAAVVNTAPVSYTIPACSDILAQSHVTQKDAICANPNVDVGMVPDDFTLGEGECSSPKTNILKQAYFRCQYNGEMWQIVTSADVVQ